MSPRGRVAITSVAAVALVVVLLVALITTPKQQPRSPLSGEAAGIAGKIGQALASGGSVSLSALRTDAQAAVGSLASGEVALIATSSGRVLRFGSSGLSHGRQASAPIVDAAASASPLGVVYVLGPPAAATHTLSSARTLVIIVCGLALLALCLVLGAWLARRPASRAARAELEESEGALRDALERLEREQRRVEELEARGDERTRNEREALIDTLVAIVDRTSDERLAGRLVQALERAGVERIEPPRGEHFDPELHRVRATTPSPDDGARDTISAVIRLGYRDHERLVREADVQVFT